MDLLVQFVITHPIVSTVLVVLGLGSLLWLSEMLLVVIHSCRDLDLEDSRDKDGQNPHDLFSSNF